jgi:hypothetical protein
LKVHVGDYVRLIQTDRLKRGILAEYSATELRRDGVCGWVTEVLDEESFHLQIEKGGESFRFHVWDVEPAIGPPYSPN